MSDLQDLVRDMRALSAGLMMRAENVTREPGLLHRFVELKRELAALADLLENEVVKKPLSD